MVPETDKLAILSLQYYCFPDEVGGAWKVTHEINLRLAAQGHRVSVITCKPGKGFADEETIDGVRFLRIGHNASKSLFGLWRALRKRIRSLGNTIQVVHIHNPLIGFLALTLPRLWRVPKVYHFHSSWHDEEKIICARQGGIGLAGRLVVIRLIEWIDFLSSDIILFLSEYSRRRFLEYFPLHPQRGGGKGLLALLLKGCKKLSFGLFPTTGTRLQVIPGGVDTQEFRPLAANESQASLREELRLPVDLPILLTVRRLEARMGLDNLIRAMAILKRRVPDLACLLLIGGKGSLRQQLEDLAIAEGLDDRVVLCGKIPNELLPLFYRAADVFILPTVSIEGFGLVTVEALASGIPVLGTPVGGTVEILGLIDNQLLFKDPSPDALADGIEKHLTHLHSRDFLKKTCRDTALQHFSWDRVVPRVEEMLIQAVKMRNRLH